MVLTARTIALAGLALAVHGRALAQAPAAQSAPLGAASRPASICGQPVPQPAALPPPASGPVVYLLGLCFAAQGNASVIEPATYLHYVQLRPSRPTQNDWVPFNDETRQTILADFERLWDTNFLDDLRIEADDYVFSNGVVGKLVTYHLEERPRVKIVTYEGSRQIDHTRIDEVLGERGIQLKLDSFVDA